MKTKLPITQFHWHPFAETSSLMACTKRWSILLPNVWFLWKLQSSLLISYHRRWWMFHWYHIQFAETCKLTLFTFLKNFIGLKNGSLLHAQTGSLRNWACIFFCFFFVQATLRQTRKMPHGAQRSWMHFYCVCFLIFTYVVGKNLKTSNYFEPQEVWDLPCISYHGLDR